MINIYFQYFASQTFSSLMIYQIYWSLKVLLSGTRTRYGNLNWSLRRFDFFFQKDEFPSMLGAHGSARILKQLPEFFNIDSDLDTALETFNKRELVKWFVDNLLCFHSVNNMHLQDFQRRKYCWSWQRDKVFWSSQVCTSGSWIREKSSSLRREQRQEIC